MKIAVDIDEVLFEFVEGYLKFVASEGHKNLSYDDIYSYELCNPLGITQGEAIDLAGGFYKSEHFDFGNIVEGAQEAIKELKNQEHELFFITSRPLSWKPKTFEFLKQEFSIDSDKVFFAGDFHKGQGKTKEKICEGLGINLIIDDRGDYGLNYAGHGIRVLMPDKPWNQNVFHENITRCEDWYEILEKIKEIENEKK